MKTLTTEEILKVEKIFIENGDVDEFLDRFPVEIDDVIVCYKKHEDGTEVMGIYLIDDVYPDLEDGVFLGYSMFTSSENYCAYNSEGEWKEIINDYFDGEFEGGDNYFKEEDDIWEKFQEAKDKKEFIRNLFKEA